MAHTQGGGLHDEELDERLLWLESCREGQARNEHAIWTARRAKYGHGDARRIAAVGQGRNSREFLVYESLLSSSPPSNYSALEKDSGMVDVIISNYFLGGSALFNERHYGRVFTIMRHPIELAVSLFHYRKIASWERSFREDFEKMEFADYVASDGYIGNWMTRQLTGTMPWVELTEQHLERAKAIMQKKIFVGIQVSTSVNQIEFCANA